MKNLFKSIILVASILVTISCSEDFLELKQENTQNVEPWTTPDFAFKTMVNLYAPLQKTHDRGYFFHIAASDDMVTGKAVSHDSGDIKNFTCTGDERGMGKWWILRYGAIRTADEMIANLDKVKGLSKAEKDMFLGEAHFTRGFMYLELAQTYANNQEGQGIPILDINLDIYQSEPRAKNIIENFKDIEASLIKAAELLPYFNAGKKNLRDRAHKTAALAYLAKTYLYWAQYDKSKYAKAVETANKIINSGKHSLLSNFKDVFAISNNYGPEYIWSVSSNAPLDEGSILPGAMFENKGWKGSNSPKEGDKLPIKVPNDNQGYNGWGYFQPTHELYTAYVNNDKRRDITLFKKGSKFVYFGEDFTWHRTSKNFTGYMFAKYIQPFASKSTVSPNGNHPNTDLNVPLIRYAEVLLIKAEALIADGKNGDTPLNKIRNRAGLPSISGATLDDLKRERRCELAGEFSNRHYDLVRWGDAEAVYSKPLTGLKIKQVPDLDENGKVTKDEKGNIKMKNKKDSEGFFETELGEVWASRKFIPSIHNVWPIPPSVIASSRGAIQQNKGW